MSGSHDNSETTASDLPQRGLRLKMKPKAANITGFVDGAWWPRTRELAIELPALLAVLAVRLGQVRRVSYNLTEWGDVARRVDVDGHTVRLGGFRSQKSGTVDVIGPDQARLTLLVVPPGTEPAAAHVMAMAAASRDNTDRVSDLLAGSDHSLPTP